MDNAYTNYNAFEKQMIEHFESEYIYDYDADFHYEVVENTKVNVKRKGLTAKYDSGEPAPIIYFDDAFEAMHENKMSLPETAEWIEMRLYDARQELPKEVLNAFDNLFTLTGENVKPVVVNAERNEELLKTAPHVMLTDDLAVLYYRQISEDAQTIINYTFLNNEECETEDLYENACDYANHNAIINTMPRVFTGQDGYDIWHSERLLKLDDPMFLLTTKDNYQGAGVILSDWLLEEIKQQMYCNYYILPSSVHEVLLIKDDGKFAINELQQMVRQVNATEVSANDFLSDNVYYYDGELHIA